MEKLTNDLEEMDDPLEWLKKLDLAKQFEDLVRQDVSLAEKDTLRRAEDAIANMDAAIEKLERGSFDAL